GDRRIMIVGLSLATAGACTLPMADTLPHTWRPAWLVGALLLAYTGLSFYFVNSGPFLIRATAVAARGNVFALQSALGGVAGFAGGLLGGLLPALFAAILLLPTTNPGPYRVPLLVVGASMAVA